MPELPEVEITRRGLLPLLHQSINTVVIRHPQLRWPIPANLPNILQNQSLIALNRRAKYILAQFQTGTLLLHLGMSGRLCLLEKKTEPEKHDHFDLEFSSGSVMRLRDPRRFGAVLWLEGDVYQHALLIKLGPEPLSEQFDGEYLYANTRTRSAAIKITIMDSHLVVGVGNIYASESLFRAGINPARPAKKLTKVQSQRLAEEIKNTLNDALDAGGSSLRDFFGVDGNPGYFQQSYFVYGREGEPCRHCGNKILSIRQGQRSTFYCKKCQP